MSFPEPQTWAVHYEAAQQCLQIGTATTQQGMTPTPQNHKRLPSPPSPQPLTLKLGLDLAGSPSWASLPDAARRGVAQAPQVEIAEVPRLSLLSWGCAVFSSVRGFRFELFHCKF